MKSFGEGFGTARERYNERVREHIEKGGGQFVDKAISVPGGLFILSQLEAQRAAVQGEFRVLDFGTGFSTVFILSWMQMSTEDTRYFGVDHDEQWLTFITSVVDEMKAAPERAAFPRYYLSTRKQFFGAPKEAIGRFDVVIVDHGPGLDERAADIPRLSKLVKPNGLMLFDDWRPKHEGRVRRALDAVGGADKWHIGSGGDALRRFEGDKSIGWARKR